MTKQSTRIDGDENLASCCWNWEKKNNSKGNQKEGEGAVPDSGTTVGDGSRHGRSKRSGPGRAPAGRRVRERRAGKRNLSRIDRGGGSRGDGRCDGFRECARRPRAGTPVARALYTENLLFFFFLHRSREFWICPRLPCFCGPAASSRLGWVVAFGRLSFGPHHTVTLVHPSAANHTCKSSAENVRPCLVQKSENFSEL